MPDVGHGSMPEPEPRLFRALRCPFCRAEILTFAEYRHHRREGHYTYEESREALLLLRRRREKVPDSKRLVLMPLPERLLASAELQTDSVVAELLREAAYELFRLSETKE